MDEVRRMKMRTDDRQSAEARNEKEASLRHSDRPDCAATISVI